MTSIAETFRDRPPNPHERYARDTHFKALVDCLDGLLEGCDFTPSELREAVILAAYRREIRNPQRTFGLGMTAEGEVINLEVSRFRAAVDAEWRRNGKSGS